MKAQNKLLKGLILASVGMFFFAFALVPLYDVFCDVTGLNGKPSLEQAPVSEATGNQRQVDIGFITHLPENSPFTVQALQPRITIILGEMNEITFSASNLSKQDRVLQAVPSVSPGLAAQHLHKVECFCFQQQPLSAGEEVQLTLLFYVDPELPRDIEELTLSYSIFDISDTLQ